MGKSTEAVSRFNVRLTGVGPRKLLVIREVRRITGKGLLESKQIVDQLGELATGLHRREATELRDRFEAVGATVGILEARGANSWPCLHGQLVDQQSNHAITGAVVTIRAHHGRLGEVVTGDEGRFRIPEFGHRVRRHVDAKPPKLQVDIHYDGRKLTVEHEPFDWQAYSKDDYRWTMRAGDPVDSEDPDALGPFVVTGTVIHPGKQSARGLVVGAFDRDLREEQALGQSMTDAEGRYQITYTREQFLRAEKARADLVLRVFNDVGAAVEISPSDVHFNAEASACIDLHLTARGCEQVSVSEYELEVAMVESLLGELGLVDLTDEDVTFLHGDTGIERAHLDLAVQDARLAEQTGLPRAVFYGIVRGGLVRAKPQDPMDLDLERLLQRSSASLLESLESSIKMEIAPESLRADMDQIKRGIDRLRQTRRQNEQSRKPWVELSGQLVDDTSGETLEGYLVSVFDASGAIEPIARGTTNGRGEYKFRVRGRDSGPQELHFAVHDPRQALVARLDRTIDLDEVRSLELSIERFPQLPPGHQIQIDDVPLELPEKLSAVLAEKQIRTLADLRTYRHDVDVADVLTGEAGRRLEAHSVLSLLPSKTATNELLIDAGHTSPVAIADLPRADFLHSVAESFDAREAGRVYEASVAATTTIENLSVEVLANLANGIEPGLPLAPSAWETFRPQVCECRDCESALSPGAYLVDLMQYVLEHVRVGDEAPSLEALSSLYHQPFAQLPLDCKSVETQVRQVRICTEVLLAHLGEDNIQFLQMHDGPGARYEFAAYEHLLEQLGTSYSELRRVREASSEEQDILARRLGVAAERLFGTTADPTALLLDPESHPLTPSGLSQRTLEEVFGLRALTQVAVDSDLPRVNILPVLRETNEPMLQKWQREFLNQQWQLHDHPEDDYLRKKLPVVDPDIIGPDDFRRPDATAQEPSAFALWRKRRRWVDQRLDALEQATIVDAQGNEVEAGRVSDYLELMATGVEYGDQQLQPWPDDAADGFDVLLAGLAAESDDDTIHGQLEALHLTAESFTRLMELWQKDRRASRDVRYETLTDEEWCEVFSILVQAQKKAFYHVWISEEPAEVARPETWLTTPERNRFFGPHHFWNSLSEPQAGRWSSRLVDWHHGAGRPFIDPENMSRDNLPETTAGAEAIALFDARELVLKSRREALRTEYENRGFDAMLDSVYGGPPADANWTAYFETLSDELKSSDAAVAAAADERLDTELAIVESQHFDALATVRIRATSTADDISPPTEDDLLQVVEFLVGADKRRRLYPNWVSEEKTQGLPYWRLLKARLPKWRADQQARMQWKTALQRRSERPIVDPDQLMKADLVERSSGPVYIIGEKRREWLDGRLAGIRRLRGAQPSNTGLDQALRQVVGVSLDDLSDLIARQDYGEDIGNRLHQLDLSRSEFRHLIRLKASLDDGVEPLEAMWRAVDHLLVAVYKRRSYADWHAAERDAALVLSPDHFRMTPRQKWWEYYAADEPRAWRRDLKARRKWRNLLEARTEQRVELVSALRDVVSRTEEYALPTLRDDLVARLDEPDLDADPTQKAEWFSERFQVDAHDAGCRQTTRVQQAIETLQGVVFSARTGVDFVLPDEVNLELQTAGFEQEWRWVGSYATWKSARAIHLYPELLLFPDMRSRETPGFSRSTQRVQGSHTSERDAQRAADDYSTYLQDVASLNLEATCVVHRDGIKQLFMVARSRSSDHLYWSLGQTAAVAEIPEQSFWIRVPSVTGDYLSKQVLGVVAYRDRVYVFFRAIKDEEEPSLYYCSLLASSLGGDLDVTTSDNTRIWSEAPIRVEMAEHEINAEDAVVVQRNDVDTPPAIVFEAANKLYYVSYLDRNIHGDESWHPPIQLELRVQNGEYEEDFEVNHGNDRDGAFLTLEAVFLGRREESLSPRTQSPTPNMLVIVSEPFADDVRFESGRTYTAYGVSPWIDTMRPNRAIGSNGRFYIGRSLQWDYDSETDTPNSYSQSRWLGAVSWDDPQSYTAATYVFWTDADSIQASRILPLDRYSDVYDNSEPVQPLDLEGVDWQDLGVLAVQCADQEGFPVLFERHNSDEEGPRLAPVKLPEESQTKLQLEDRFVGLAPVLGDLSASLADPPSLSDPHERTPVLTEALMANRGARGTRMTEACSVYIEEAFYLLPIHLALQLRVSGHYDEALRWLRVVYNYRERLETFPFSALRRLAEGGEDTSIDQASRYEPRNPHEVAAARPRAHLRFTLLVIIQALLDYGNSEFARDTSESVSKARRLYNTALDLLDNHALKAVVDPCRDIERVAHSEPSESVVISEISESTEVEARTPAKIFANAGQAREAILYEFSANDETATYIENAARKATERRASLNSDSQDAQPETYRLIPLTWYQFCVPPNPIVSALREHLSLNLRKIRTCRNIAGMQRDLQPYAVPTDVQSALPAGAIGGSTSSSGLRTIRPTQYRYSALVNRAKELVNLARQIESEFLHLLQQLDQENYQLLTARQGIELARAGVRLRDLQVRTAEGHVSLTELQKQAAQMRVETYQEWLDAGLNRWEQTMVSSYKTAGAARMMSTHLNAALRLAEATASSSLQGAGALGAVAALTMLQATADEVAIAADTNAQVASVRAGHARREQQWSLQKELAEHDIRISSQQIRLAETQVEIAEQQREIAELEVQHSEEIVEYLQQGQFTTAKLYGWMSQVLERVYRYFLQQATSMAKLAERQLAFERQQVPPRFIQSDYWLQSSERGDQGGDSSEERRGLTGSARLLRDLYKLDQHAFQNDERKLQVRKTLSLAQIDAYAFEQFRQTGVLHFPTPMELFDRDYPGHYLRLIHRVNVTVLALTPPTEGIKATLTNSGISRVVTSGPPFQTHVIQRQPESIALSSAHADSGIFQLEADREALLRPFEKTGVDTLWELRMPQASNHFNYETLTDVLFTIEYTALDSYDYRQRVIQRLDPEVSFQRAFSIRHDLPDQWYQLHHAGRQDTSLSIAFETTRGDFPTNLDDLAVEGVLLYFATGEEVLERTLRTTLEFEPRDEETALGGRAQPVDHLISTARGNGSGWMAVLGSNPIGRWQLTFANTPQTRRLFEKHSVDDILFVITCEGRTPDRPE